MDFGERKFAMLYDFKSITSTTQDFTTPSPFLVAHIKKIDIYITLILKQVINILKFKKNYNYKQS